MEKVRPWCGQPSDRGRLKNRTEQNNVINVNKNYLQRFRHCLYIVHGAVSTQLSSVCLSVCPSVRQFAGRTPPLRVCYCRPGSQEVSIDCCTAGEPAVQQQPRRSTARSSKNAGNATLSAIGARLKHRLIYIYTVSQNNSVKN